MREPLVKISIFEKSLEKGVIFIESTITMGHVQESITKKIIEAPYYGV